MSELFCPLIGVFSDPDCLLIHVSRCGARHAPQRPLRGRAGETSRCENVGADCTECYVWRCCCRFTPTGKQASELTCLAWGKVPASATASATKKKKAKQVHDVVVIGNAVGGLMLWDCNRAELRQTFGGEGSGHTGKVNDVALNASGTLLYSCTADCHVTCWNVSTGAQSWRMSVGKHAASRVLVHGDDDEIVTASTAIKIWDLSTRSSTRKLRGHAAEVSCMTYSPDHKFLISASRDRFVLVWQTAGDSSDPVVTLTLDSSPLLLAMRNTPADCDDDNKTELLAVSEAGAVAIWRFNPLMHNDTKPKSGKKAAKTAPSSMPRDVRPLTPSCYMLPGSGKGSFPVRSARFHGVDGESVQVCGGSHVLPSFLVVPVMMSLLPPSSSPTLQCQPNPQRPTPKASKQEASGWYEIVLHAIRPAPALSDVAACALCEQVRDAGGELIGRVSLAAKGGGANGGLLPKQSVDKKSKVKGEHGLQTLSAADTLPLNTALLPSSQKKVRSTTRRVPHAQVPSCAWWRALVLAVVCCAWRRQARFVVPSCVRRDVLNGEQSLIPRDYNPFLFKLTARNFPLAPFHKTHTPSLSALPARAAT
jgi:hypothetical protein